MVRDRSPLGMLSKGSGERRGLRIIVVCGLMR